MKNGRLFLIFTAVMVSLILAACSPSGNSGFPTGKFVRSDNPDGGMIFNKDGTWSAYSGIYTLAKGTYSVKGDVYTEESSDSNCPEPMSFKYTYDGKELKFQYADDPGKDPCDGRRDGFDGRIYIPAK